MKIEADKPYRQRNGKRFDVHATDAKGPFPVHGVTEGEDEIPSRRTAEGKFFANERESDYDLVAEWCEPVEYWRIEYCDGTLSAPLETLDSAEERAEYLRKTGLSIARIIHMREVTE